MKVPRTKTEKIYRDTMDASFSKTLVGTLYIAIAHVLFAFISFNFVTPFRPELTLFQYVWPRVLGIAFPFIGIYFLLKKSNADKARKLQWWCLGYAILNAASASLYIWPIALEFPIILLYCTATNNLVFVATGVYLGFPRNIFYCFFGCWALFFFTPLIYLSSSDSTIFNVILNDVGLYSLTLFAFRAVIQRIYTRPIEEKHDHIEKSGRYMDEEISAAFENGTSLEVLSGDRKLFILQIDVRGYTVFLKQNKNNKDLLRSFSHDLSALVRRATKKFGGKVHKSAGDGYHCFFMEKTSTSDVNHLEDFELSEVEYRKNLLFLVMQTFEGISRDFDLILKKYDLGPMKICGGIHYGEVLFDFFGDENRIEYDVVSVDLALVSRLEEFTKRLQLKLGKSNYLVLSNEALQYLDKSRIRYEILEYTFTHLDGDSLRNFEEVERIYFTDFHSKHYNSNH